MLNPEDDIEDIYRQFAEHYPLNPGDAGWDELQARMARSSAAPNNKPAGIKKYWYVLAALLVLLIATIGIQLYSSQKNIAAPKKAGEKQQNGLATLPATTADTITAQLVKPPVDSPITSVNSKGFKAKKPYNNTVAANGIATHSKPAYYRPTQTKAEHFTTNDDSLTTAATGSMRSRLIKNNTGNVNAYPLYVAGQLAHIPGFGQMNDDNRQVALQSLTGTLTNYTLQGNAGIKKAGKQAAGFKNRLYLSLVLGPDISTVKFQGGSNTGISAGVMLGIKLSNNVSLETGLLADKKNYFSSGQYFNKTGAGITDPDDNISSVDGVGNFIEVPVIARFNVINKRKSTVFIAGGFSSYITHRERYDLSIERPTGQERRTTDDDDWRANLFSVMHLSAGYAYKINARNALQIEPYFKLPLAGIGRASLPITSTGVYLKYIIGFGK